MATRTPRKTWWQTLADESAAWRELLAQRLQLDAQIAAGEAQRLDRLEQLIHTVGVDLVQELLEDVGHKKNARAELERQLRGTGDQDAGPEHR